MIDWSKVGPAGSPSPSTTTTPIAAPPPSTPIAAPTSPAVNVQNNLLAKPTAAVDNGTGHGFHAMDQATVDALNPFDRVGRGIDFLGNALFGSDENSLLKQKVGPVQFAGDVVGTVGNVLHATGDWTVVKPIEATATGLAHIPLGFVPGGADDTFTQMGNWAKDNNPEMYKQWQLVSTAANADVLGGGNLKADFNMEAAKMLDDMTYEGTLGSTPELAMGREGIGSVGGAISHAIQSLLGVASNQSQEFTGNLGLWDPGTSSATYEQQKDRFTNGGGVNALGIGDESKKAFEELAAGTINEDQARKIVETASKGGRGRLDEIASRYDLGLEVSDVEKHAIEAFRAGAWSKNHAEDWIVSHGQGVTRNLLGQIAGAGLTDPLVYATLGAGSIAGAGARGVMEGERILGSGYQALSSGEKLALAAQQEGKLLRVQMTVAAVQQDSVLGPIARRARALIDPFAVYKPSTVARATTDLMDGSAIAAVGRAYGHFNMRDARAIYREFGKGEEFDTAVASYAKDKANEYVMIRAQSDLLGEGLGEQIMHVNADDLTEALARNADRDAVTQLTDHVSSVAKNTFTKADEADLNARLADALGHDVAYWAKRTADMNHELKSILHMGTYKQAEKGFEEARARMNVAEYTGSLPLRNMVLVAPETLVEHEAQALVDELKGMLASNTPERIASATNRWNEQARQFGALGNIGYATGGKQQVETLIKELQRQIDNRAITKVATEEELHEPVMAPIIDYLDAHSAVPPTGAAGATPEDIQAAYDAGDTAAGQALNREVAGARGGTAESGGAVRPDDMPGVAPEAQPEVLTPGNYHDMPGVDDPGYVYHVTGRHDLYDIADNGLEPHTPDYRGEQEVWPDGSEAARSYFAKTAKGTEPFSTPDNGGPAIIRVKEGSRFSTDKAGEIVTPDHIPATDIEYLKADGTWAPLKAATEPAKAVGADDLKASWLAAMRPELSSKDAFYAAGNIQPGNKAASIKAFDALPDDAPVWVFHSTDKATADRLAGEGVDMANTPQNLARQRYAAGEDAEFAPGAGVGQGMYVGGTAYGVEGYGKSIIAMRVRKGDIVIPPEGEGSALSLGDALANHDGALLTKNVAPEDIVRLEDTGRIPGDSYDEIAKVEGVPAAAAPEAPAAAAAPEPTPIDAAVARHEEATAQYQKALQKHADEKTAYSAGWAASKRAGKTNGNLDLDAAEARFEAKNGRDFGGNGFAAGWEDNAVGKPRGASLSEPPLEPPPVYYRGTTPGSAKRIRTGDDWWDNHTFITDDPKHAAMYGTEVRPVELRPNSRILKEGTPEFTKIAGRPMDESALSYSSRIAQAAEAQGYDAVHFARQGDVGTIVLNPKAIVRPPLELPTLQFVDGVPQKVKAPLFDGTFEEQSADLTAWNKAVDSQIKAAADPARLAHAEQEARVSIKFATDKAHPKSTKPYFSATSTDTFSDGTFGREVTGFGKTPDEALDNLIKKQFEARTAIHEKNIAEYKAAKIAHDAEMVKHEEAMTQYQKDLDVYQQEMGAYEDAVREAEDAAAAAVDEVPEDVQNVITKWAEKGKNATRLRADLEKLSDKGYDVDQADSLLDEYTDIERTGMSIEEFNDEKQSAWDAIMEELEAVPPLEKEADLPPEPIPPIEPTAPEAPPFVRTQRPDEPPVFTQPEAPAAEAPPAEGAGGAEVPPPETPAAEAAAPEPTGPKRLWRVGWRPDEEVSMGLKRDGATGRPVIDRAPTISHVVDATPGRQPFSDTTRNILGQVIGKSNAERINRPIDSMEAFINTMRDQVTGHRLVMNMSQRFERSTFDIGMPKQLSRDIWRAATDVAGLEHSTIRGVQPGNLWDEIHAMIPRDLVLSNGETLNVHIVMDHLLTAAEGDLRVMGLTSNLSQRMRNALRRGVGPAADPANWTGAMTVTTYNKLRYSQPMFLIQRITDAPYYSILYGVTPVGKRLNAADTALQAITDNLGRTGLGRDFSMDMPEYSVRSNFTAGIKSELQQRGLKDSRYDRILNAPDAIIASNMTHMLNARVGDIVAGVMDNIASTAEKASPEFQAEMIRAGEGLQRSFADWRRVYSESAGRTLSDSEVGLAYMQDTLNAWRRHIVNADGTLDYTGLINEGHWMTPTHIGEIVSIRPDALAKELGYRDLAAMRADLTGTTRVTNGRFELVPGEHDLPWLEEVMRDKLHAHPDVIQRAQVYFGDDWQSFWRHMARGTDEGGLDISPHYAKEAQDVIAREAQSRGMDPWEYLSTVMSRNIGAKDLETHVGQLMGFLKSGKAERPLEEWTKMFQAHLDESAQRTLIAEFESKVNVEDIIDVPVPGAFGSAVPPSAPGAPARPAVATLPKGYTTDPGYVYRIEQLDAARSGWQPRTGVSTEANPMYVRGDPGEGVFRSKIDPGNLATGRHGAGGKDRLTTVHTKPEDIEMLDANGNWVSLGEDPMTKIMAKDFPDAIRERILTGKPHPNPEVEAYMRAMSKWVNDNLGPELARNTRSHLRRLVEAIPQDGGSNFNRSQALVVSLLKNKIEDAQADIFRLAEMQTQRSVLERSLNHPLFGLYPSSYMWGKVLPETVKFLAKNPYAATYQIADVQRAIAIQREYDRGIEDKVSAVDRSAGAFLLDYLTPSLPWSDHSARMSPLVRDLFGGKDPGQMFADELSTISPQRWVKQVVSTANEIPGAIESFGKPPQQVPTWQKGLQSISNGETGAAPTTGAEGAPSEITGPTKASALAPILEEDFSRLSSILLQGAAPEE